MQLNDCGLRRQLSILRAMEHLIQKPSVLLNSFRRVLTLHPFNYLLEIIFSLLFSTPDTLGLCREVHGLKHHHDRMSSGCHVLFFGNYLLVIFGKSIWDAVLRLGTSCFRKVLTRCGLGGSSSSSLKREGPTMTYSAS